MSPCKIYWINLSLVLDLTICMVLCIQTYSPVSMFPVHHLCCEKMYRYNKHKKKFSTSLNQMMETNTLVQNKILTQL